MVFNEYGEIVTLEPSFNKASRILDDILSEGFSDVVKVAGSIIKNGFINLGKWIRDCFLALGDWFESLKFQPTILLVKKNEALLRNRYSNKLPLKTINIRNTFYNLSEKLLNVISDIDFWVQSDIDAIVHNIIDSNDATDRNSMNNFFDLIYNYNDIIKKIRASVRNIEYTGKILVDTENEDEEIMKRAFGKIRVVTATVIKEIKNAAVEYIKFAKNTMNSISNDVKKGLL